METTEREDVDSETAIAGAFDYECMISGIRITLGPDCVPTELQVPPEVFGRRAEEFSRFLVTAFADASAACQHHASGTMGDLASLDDPGDDPIADVPGRLDVEECLARLHTVANVLTRSHHELLTSTSMGTDSSKLVRATANSSGAITALTLSPLLASEGIDAAQKAIVSAAASAVSAANDSRAAVIEDALGTVLMNSLARKWN